MRTRPARRVAGDHCAGFSQVDAAGDVPGAIPDNLYPESGELVRSAASSSFTGIRPLFV
jgi:hypothetical protein